MINEYLQCNQTFLNVKGIAAIKKFKGCLYYHVCITNYYLELCYLSNKASVFSKSLKGNLLKHFLASNGFVCRAQHLLFTP